MFFSSFRIPEEFVWALNRQFAGNANTGGLKADSRHQIKRLRGEDCQTLLSNSGVRRKSPFVLIHLSGVTHLDTSFPNFTYNLQICDKKGLSWDKKHTNRQTLNVKERRWQQANSRHWAIHELNTGSLFSCTHRCTPSGTLYSADGKKKILIILIGCEGIEVMRGLSKCAAVILPQDLPPCHFRESHWKHEPTTQGGQTFKERYVMEVY